MYLSKRRPKWLETRNVLNAFELKESRKGTEAYGRYLEKRAKDRDAALNDEALDELRQGWYLGEESFGKKLAEALKARMPIHRESVSGAASRAHDESEATRLVNILLERLDMPKGRVALAGRAKWQREKALICWILRKRTGVGNRWLADRLSMGHVSSVTRSLRQVKDTKLWLAEAQLYDQMLEF